VPLSTQAPLTFPGMLSTAGHCDQSSVSRVSLFVFFGVRRLGAAFSSRYVSSAKWQKTKAKRGTRESPRGSICAPPAYDLLV